MPVRVVKHIQSLVENGVGAFVQPCRRITLRYCNWGGSSRGMREFLRTQLRDVAAANPQLEVIVEHKSGHPVITGEYAGGLTKAVCVRNMDSAKIMQKVNLVRDSSGAKLQKYQRAVESRNKSVRGIWSPFHVEKDYRFRI